MLQDHLARWTLPTPEPAALGRGEPRTIGPFRIRSRLGSGGMGDVYLGTGRRGQQVAIKLIRGAQLDDSEFRARFRREARAAARVRSRFVANLVDADLDAGTPWLATEYVAGPTLSQALKVHGPLPQEAVLNLVAGVAEALHTIHRSGLVHRDVKPANVILGPDGPCLIDLGVVAAMDALDVTKLTMTGQPVGTPMYMAPEQAMAGRATAAADVWALGALAYYAATGNRLFSGTHPAVVLYQVSAEDPSYDDCPAYLRPLLDACLVKDPAGRPSLDTILRSLGPYVSADAAAAAAADAGAGAASAGAAGAAAGVGAADAGTASAAGAAAIGAAAGVDRREPAPAGGTGSPLGARRALVRLSAVVAGAAVLSAAVFGAWSALTDNEAPAGTERAPVAGAPQASGDPTNGPLVEPPETGVLVQDGSHDSPWAQGTAQRLSDGSCWTVSVDDVQGQLATLTLSCDQAGTAAYGTPTPSEWLTVSAVGADGTVASSTPADAMATDTFWAQGNLMDAASVTTTITLPDVGPLATVAVQQNRGGYGWEWAATR